MAKRREKTDSARFKKIEMLSGFSDTEVEALRRIAKEVKVPAGEVIMREGDVGDSMYLFAEGQVMVTKNLTLKTGKRGFSQAEKSMVRLDARYVSFFGDMAMFENDVRSATLTASTDCLLYEIKRDDFERLAQQNCALGYMLVRRIAEVLCHRVRQGNQDILKLTTALSIALSK
ncbi:MAG: cyclic nucleotide-binding domain-containing protein [Spirochaetaceae bacterium]|nr:MAG: cyclic nucleotide-binding domain-containing protein [Spirochaetaceae bacterium]